MAFFIQGKMPKREKYSEIQSRFPLFPSPTTTKGNVSERNQHRPSKDTRIRPVQSRTSPMILTYNYQRIINLGREGPMTTPTQTKGQRSSLGLPVTSTPFSDLNAFCQIRDNPRPPSSNCIFEIFPGTPPFFLQFPTSRACSMTGVGPSLSYPHCGKIC